MSFQIHKTFVRLRKHKLRYFFMKSESSLTLHRQQRNWNIPRPRNVVRTSVKQSMWHKWLNFNFTKLREYFSFTKKTKITEFIQQFFSPSYHIDYVLGKAHVYVVVLSKMAEDGNFWVIISIFGWTNPLSLEIKTILLLVYDCCCC